MLVLKIYAIKGSKYRKKLVLESLKKTYFERLPSLWWALMTSEPSRLVEISVDLGEISSRRDENFPYESGDRVGFLIDACAFPNSSRQYYLITWCKQTFIPAGRMKNYYMNMDKNHLVYRGSLVNRYSPPPCKRSLIRNMDVYMNLFSIICYFHNAIFW